MKKQTWFLLLLAITARCLSLFVLNTNPFYYGGTAQFYRRGSAGSAWLVGPGRDIRYYSYALDIAAQRDFDFEIAWMVRSGCALDSGFPAVDWSDVIFVCSTLDSNANVKLGDLATMGTVYVGLRCHQSIYR